MRVDQENDSKGKDKDLQDIYKFRESTRKALAIVDNKHFIVEQSLARPKPFGMRHCRHLILFGFVINKTLVNTSLE